MSRKYAVVFEKQKNKQGWVPSTWCWFKLKFSLKTSGSWSAFVPLINLLTSPFLLALLCKRKEIALPWYPWILFMWLEKQNHSLVWYRNHSVYSRALPQCKLFKPTQLYHNRLQLYLTDQTRFTQRTQYFISLFLWLKIGRGANVPDETHHSDVNILSFFGLKVLDAHWSPRMLLHKSSSGLSSVWSMFLIWYNWYFVGLDIVTGCKCLASRQLNSSILKTNTK